MRVLFILLLLSPSLSIAKDWYVGLSAGRTVHDNKGTLYASDNTDSQTSEKGFDSKNFSSGSIFLGQTLPFKSFGSGFIEGFYAINGENSESQVANGVAADLTVRVKRPKTFGLNVGFSRPIGGDIEAFVRAGLVMSQFKTTLTDTGPVDHFRGQDSQYVWGFAPGLGLQSTFGDYRVGFSYSYYMYQQFTAKSIEVNSQSTYSNKMSPRYHVVELSVARKF